MAGRQYRFQSAPLLREATVTNDSAKIVRIVSIRASLARGDGCRCLPRGCGRCFNPRLSCERRHFRVTDLHRFHLFQSAPLLREATLVPVMVAKIRRFQSAPLLREATHHNCHYRISPRFNPRLSCERRLFLLWFGVFRQVSIRASLARGDPADPGVRPSSAGFNPRLSCERRLRSILPGLLMRSFNPRLSCERRPAMLAAVGSVTAFQSAPLLREATGAVLGAAASGLVSIRASLARGDRKEARRCRG